MSTDLNVLLQRIEKPENRKPIEEPAPISTELSALLNRTNNRKWQEAELLSTLHNLQVLQEDIEGIKHIRKCKQSHGT